jgi:ubiquinone/menaquinone biosynthesis C-methylase UbiE
MHAPARVACPRCGASIGADAVAVDFVDVAVRAPSWGARAMQSEWLASVYEKVWRPVVFKVSTGFAAPDADDEMRRIRGLIADRPGPWLDLSCGPGTFLRRLVQQGDADGRLLVAADLSRAMLERARVAAPNALRVRTDAADLPFEDAIFGAVTNLAALDLYSDPQAVLHEIARVLAPGGRWVCSSFVRRGPSSVGGTRLTRASGVRTPSIREIAAWAERAGLARFGHLLFGRYAIAWADRA